MTTMNNQERLTMKPHHDVLIATPGASLNNEYVRSLMATIQWLNSNNISWQWLNAAGSLVGDAREMTLGGDRQLNIDDRGPLHDQCSYNKIFWIDSDIAWTVADFAKLYQSQHDIVSGAYLLANGTVSTIHTSQHPDGIPRKDILKLKNAMAVDLVGFGFVAVKSGVFEQIQRPWFGHLSRPVTDSAGKNLFVTVGEDISWCMKAQQAGFDIYFEPSVLVQHMKTLAVGWS